MLSDHLITLDDSKHTCIYCGTQIKKDWQSEFVEKIHYKSTVCTCGKKISITVPWEGSGHDSWSPNVCLKEQKNVCKIHDLEDKITSTKRIGPK